MSTLTRPKGMKLYRGPIPVQIRVYDNGGETLDRYTVIYPVPEGDGHPYASMGALPVRAFGTIHYDSQDRPIDLLTEVGTWTREPPDFGKRHFSLGKRIRFNDLPEPCRRQVSEDYKRLWGV